MKAENTENRMKVRFLVPLLFSVMVVMALIAGLWPFQTGPENGARLKGNGLEFTGMGIANASCAGRPLFPSGEATVELAATPLDLPLDWTGALISFHDSGGKMVLTVFQWSDRLIISSGPDVAAGVRSVFALNRGTLLAVSAGKDGIRIFVDGKPYAGSPKPFQGLDKVTCFTLGATPEGRHPWQGRLERFALWSRALSDDEAGRGSVFSPAGAGPDLSGLAGSYNFEGSGRVVRNAVPGELDISVPETFRPVRRVFLGPLFEDSGRFRFEPMDAAVNLIGFMPLGFLAFFLRPASRTGAASVLFAVSAGFVLSLFIETVQVFMPERFSHLPDLLLNTSGALAGALFALFLRRLGMIRRSIH